MADLLEVNVADDIDKGREDCFIFFLGLVGPAVFDFLALDVLLDEVSELWGPGGLDRGWCCFDGRRRQWLVVGAVTKVTTVTTRRSIKENGGMILAPLECAVDVVDVGNAGLEQVLGDDGKASGLPKGLMVVGGLE